MRANAVAQQGHFAARVRSLKRVTHTRAVFVGDAPEKIQVALRCHAKPLAQRRSGMQEPTAPQYATGNKIAREQRQRHLNRQAIALPRRRLR